MDKIYEAYTNILNEAKKTATFTLDGLFSWYAGDKDWYKDWQTTNSLEVDGKHAQNNLSNNEIVAMLTDWHKKYGSKKFKVTVNKTQSDLEISFNIGKNKVLFIAVVEEDDMYDKGSAKPVADFMKQFL